MNRRKFIKGAAVAGGATAVAASTFPHLRLLKSALKSTWFQLGPGISLDWEPAHSALQKTWKP